MQTWKIQKQDDSFIILRNEQPVANADGEVATYPTAEDARQSAHRRALTAAQHGKTTVQEDSSTWPPVYTVDTQGQFGAADKSRARRERLKLAAQSLGYDTIDRLAQAIIAEDDDILLAIKNILHRESP